jgi:hypothetical protein
MHTLTNNDLTAGEFEKGNDSCASAGTNFSWTKWGAGWLAE